MFPIPSSIINIIGLPTKVFSTDIGLWIVRAVGIPFLREGFVIHLSESMMIVGTPCNGMKSLISFMALGSLALYMIRLKLWQNMIVIVGIYPLAIMMNGLRIALLILIAEYFGIEKAAPESYLHGLSGIVVFFIGLAILFVGVSIWSEKSCNNSTPS
jgi:exosortase